MKRMVLRRATACVAIAAIMGGAIGCGEDKAAKEREARAAAAAAQKAKDRRAEARRRAEAQAKATACKEHFDDFLTVLSELNSRLDVGMNYEEYTKQVGDVKVAYDQVGFDEVKDVDCLGQVGVPAEAALNQYTRALNTWSACFDDISCSNDDIQPSLQKRWSRASAKTEAAKAALDDMQPS